MALINVSFYRFVLKLTKSLIMFVCLSFFFVWGPLSVGELPVPGRADGEQRGGDVPALQLGGESAAGGVERLRVAGVVLRGPAPPGES